MKACIFVVIVWIGKREISGAGLLLITAGEGSSVHLFSIPLLVCFPCSSSGGGSSGVVGWIHVPNPPAISTSGN